MTGCEFTLGVGISSGTWHMLLT